LICGLLNGQDSIEIQEGISFWYVCMEFEGAHSQISEKAPLLFEEIYKQELQSKVRGDLFGVFFDSPLLGEGKRSVYALGFIIDKEIAVEMPLIKYRYVFQKIATVIHHGPYETVANSFNNLLASIEEQGLEIDGPPLQIWMGDPRRDKPEELMTKIIIPVRRNSRFQKRGLLSLRVI
jgi:effector-binding domain-containing protein